MALKERLTKTLSDLTKFETVTGNAEETRKLYDYVKSRLKALPVRFEETESNGFRSLCVFTSDTKPRVTLQAHVDVVTADPEQFFLREKDGRLYGRGVYDMKFAAACYIELFLELGDSLKSYEMAIMLTDDEETGGADGVQLLLEQGYKTDVVVIPDGGDDWRLEARAKGAWEVRLHCRGIAAHGSQPWKGDNASEKLVRLIHALYEQLPNDPSGITCNVTQLEALTSHNQIPGLATAAVDTRFVTQEQGERVRNVVGGLAKAYNADVTTILEIEPVSVDLTHPLVKQFEDAVRTVRGKTRDPTMSYGASDGRFFHRENIPVLIMRPEGGDAHGGSEWIDASSFAEYHVVIRQYIDAVAKNVD